MKRSLTALLSTLTLLAASSALAAPSSGGNTYYPPVPPWPGEPPKLLTVESPCPGPQCQAELRDPAKPNALGRRVIYLNFDGASFTRSSFNDDARENISAIVTSSMSTPAFQPSDLGFDGGLSRAEIIQYTIDQLEESYADFDVEFTTTRPDDGNYHMITFVGAGADCGSVAGASCAGIALRDCSEQMPNNIVFVFTWGLRYADLAQVAAHEGGHALGLDHIDNTDAIMYYAVQNHVTTEFREGPIFGPDVSGACFGLDYQDSRDRLMDNIGPRGQDVLAPSIDIISPLNGATVVTSSPVITTISDIDSQVKSVTFSINGTTIETKAGGPFEFTLPAETPKGAATLRIQATDIGGNTSSAQVAVTVAGDIACSTPDDCPTGLRCGEDGVCVPDSVPGTLGSPCATNDECSSGLCGTVNGESRCTQACDSDSACPGGFECLDQTACWPAQGGGGGCSVGGGGAAPGLLLLFAAALFGGTRRRRQR